LTAQASIGSARNDGKSEHARQVQANHLQKYVKVLNIQNIIGKTHPKRFFALYFS
jgi:hypothetical protein